MSDNKRIGLYISEELLDLCDRNIGRDDSRSRSEFVCNAIEFYIASLDKAMVEGFLSPALEAVISARVKDTENKLARVVFKQSVELAMLIHILSGVYQIDSERIDGLRQMCANKVSALGGKYTFEDIVRFQSREDG